MSTASGAFGSLQGSKYLSLETYRRNGVGVRTPVWFAADASSASVEILYVYSEADSGKAKRIRNNPRVRIAPCDMRGTVKGEWIDAQARIVSGEEVERGMRLLNRKYFPWRQLLELFSKLRPKPRVVFAISPS
jgi:PPOX class probable F420-dependent enzyme